MSRLKIYGTMVVFFIVLLVGLTTIKDYGINWDEPVHYLRGQAYLRYFLTGKKNYDDLPKLRSHYSKFDRYQLPTDITYENESSFRRSIYQFDREGKRLMFSWFIDNDSGHPPLNGILASFFNYILYQKLGVFGDMESYHVFIVFVSAMLTASVFLFTAYYYGIFSALVASFTLFLYPLFFSESHFNIKDPVEASFYSIAIIIFVNGVIKEKWKLLLISAVFFGFALGTKFNIFFALITIFFWLVIYKFEKLKKREWPFSISITMAIISIPFISSAILFFSWPFLWKNSWQHFLSILSYYKDIGTTSYQVKRGIFLGFNTYALQWILFTTPLVTLFLSTFGIVFAFLRGFKEKEKTALLVLFWLVVPIARVTMPNAGIYGGVRQIMEFVPAMAILAGIGARYIVTLLQGSIVLYKKQLNNKTIQQLSPKTTLLALQVLSILMFVPITLKLISIHPNENVYFNPLIGGLRGAKERNLPDWGTTLGSVNKQGVDWLNVYAEPDAKLTLIKGFTSNIPRTMLREDINFYDKYYSGNKMRGEYLMEVIDYRWNEDILEEKRKYLQTLKPLFEVKVDDTTILTIWKNDEKHSGKK